MTNLDLSAERKSENWWMVFVFCIAGFVSYVCRLILSVLVIPIQHDLRIDDAQLSLLQGAAFAIVYVFAGLPLGWLADKGKRKNIVIFGSIIWSVGTLLCGASSTYWALFGSRILVGIGEAALAPAAASMISDAFAPSRRGTAFGIFLMGMAVGGPAAVGIGGKLLTLGREGAFASIPILGQLVPWRATLTIVGLTGLLIPLLVATLNEPKRAETISSNDKSSKEVLNYVWTNKKSLLTLLFAIAMLSVGDYGLFSWLPTALERRFLWKPDLIGSIFTIVTTIAAVGGAVLGGIISDFVAIKKGAKGRYLVSIASAIFGALAAVMVASNNVNLVLFGLGLWTFSSSVGAINGIAILQNLIPSEMRGIAMSLVAFCNTLLGLGCGPTVVAVITEYYFKSQIMVGASIAMVVTPAAMLAFSLFLISKNSVKET